MYNLIQIRNYYIGEHGCIDGEHKLEKAYRDFGATSKCWKEKISEIKGIVGEDYSISSKKSLTLVGELQFGNWALGYYDLPMQQKPSQLIITFMSRLPAN